LKLNKRTIHILNFRAAKISRCLCILLFLFSTAMSPLAISGETLSKYRADVVNAKLLIQSLTYSDADEEISEEKYAERERIIVANIRTDFPAGEKIEWQGTTTETNNKWLTDKLDVFDVEAPESPAREAILIEIGERLEAIEQKLDEIEKPVASNRTKDEDKQKLAEILRREEYTKPDEPKESLFQMWWRKLKDLLAGMFPRPDLSAPQEATGFQSLSFILQMILYALVLGIIGFLIYRFAPFIGLLISRFMPFLAQKFKNREKREKGERVILGERLAEGATAQNLFNEAEKLAYEGNLRGAIRQGYIAVLCELADRKVIGLANHKTNRDYLRDVRKERVLYENMNGLTANFERHWYGTDSVEEKDWDEFRQGYKRVTTK